MEVNEQTITRLEQLLEDTLEVAEENNKLLRSMRRASQWAFQGKIILWLIVLGVPVLIFGPHVKALLPLSDGTSHGIFGLPSADQLKELISAYQASGTASGTPTIAP
jgi:hypothetical protein